MNFRDSKNSIMTQRKDFSSIVVNGRFKVVYFRVNMQEIAKKILYLAGCELTDGRVEALLEGNKDGVDKVIEWSKKVQ